MYRLWETNLNATVKPKLFTQDWRTDSFGQYIDQTCIPNPVRNSKLYLFLQLNVLIRQQFIYQVHWGLKTRGAWQSPDAHLS